MPDDRDLTSDWTKKTDWMRENGAIEASFSESGKLLSVRLSPERPSDEDEEQPNQRETQEQAMKRLEAERRRLAFGASARLVKRESST